MLLAREKHRSSFFFYIPRDLYLGPRHIWRAGESKICKCKSLDELSNACGWVTQHLGKYNERQLCGASFQLQVSANKFSNTVHC